MGAPIRRGNFEAMKVRSVFHPGAEFVTPAESLREAAIKMRGSGQGCLPVLDGSSFTGILTEHDLAQAAANGARPSEAHVMDYTNDGSVTVSLDDDCEAAEIKMLTIGCRNLPVLDGGKLVGMISMCDVLLKARASEGHRHPSDVAVAGAALPSEWPEEAPPDVDSES